MVYSFFRSPVSLYFVGYQSSGTRNSISSPDMQPHAQASLLHPAAVVQGFRCFGVGFRV